MHERSRNRGARFPDARSSDGDARQGEPDGFGTTSRFFIFHSERAIMGNRPSDTESVVRTHLQAFLDREGIPAIMADYDDDACFLSEDRAYRGRHEIAGFFQAFLATLPPLAIERFALRSLRVEGELAHVVWSAGRDLPLGTDTFVVRNGRIVSQTFAMHAARPA
jgi:hypothetical protein